MNTTRAIKQLGEAELKNQNNSSWHDDYRKSSYIFIANLNFGMNEGDIAIVFSQFGEIVDVHLVRDRETGKSKGFCFLAYEDQRSTVLAIDNFNYSEVCGRLIRVDHVKEFKAPREYYEVAPDDPQIFDKLYKPSGPDGRGWGQFRQLNEEELELTKQIENQKQQVVERNERILQNIEQIKDVQGIIDEDERWDKMLMIEDEKQQLQEKIQALQSFNTRMSKPKKQKEIIQETNAERAQRLDKEKQQRQHKNQDTKKENKEKKDKKDKKNKKDKKDNKKIKKSKKEKKKQNHNTEVKEEE